ncbi:MAG: hypothetical protein EXS29_00835 [Pedosphaera sp.]|nr:hypothetical protein [Pedosphaera sp.]MSS99846.1 hypothetical protein [Pedosphaera sp.]
MDDDQFYQTVAEELRENRINEALWTKSIARSGGDPNKTKALYIQMRVSQLTQEDHRQRVYESDVQPEPVSDSLWEKIEAKLGPKWTRVVNYAAKAALVAVLIVVILNAGKIGPWLRGMIGF